MAKILVIDDHPVSREFLSELLRSRSYDVVEAADGREGLDVARREHPDLVITDILMPTIDGFEFARRLRAEPQISATPLIFFTASYHDREAAALAASVGVARFLTKPSDSQVIVEAVETTLRGTPVRAPRPSGVEFDREHLKVVSDKLVDKLHELERTSARLDALVNLELSLATEQNPQRLFRELCSKARELIGSRIAFVGVLDDTGAGYRHRFTCGVDPDLVAGFVARSATGGLLARVTSERASVHLAGAEADAEVRRLHTGLAPVTSLLAVPIATPSNVFGWLCLLDRLGSDEFSAADEQLARVLGAAGAVPYENLRRYEAVQRSSDRLALLHEIDASILGARSVDEIADTAAHRIHDLIRCDRVHVVIFDAGFTHVKIVAQNPPAEPGFEIGSSFALGAFGDITAMIDQLRHGRVQRVDLASWVRTPYTVDMIARGMRYYTVVPLIALGSLIGAFAFRVERRDALTDEDLEIASEVAAQLAVAIQQGTQRRHIEEAEARYHGLFDHVPVCVFRSLADSTIVDFNRAGVEMLGFPSVESVKGLSTADLYADPEDHRRLIARLERDGIVNDFEAMLRCHDGRTIWGSISVRATHDAQGTLTGFDGIAANVTARKLAEEALREREHMLDGLFNASPAGMAILDGELRYLRINEPLARMNGSSVDRHFGRSVREIIGEAADTVEPLLETVLASGEPMLNVEITAATPSAPGVTRNWVASFFPISDRSRLPVALGTVVVEVTDVREAERKLRVALRRAEDGDRLKTAFLANMSHEVRTPLNVILGYNTLIAERLAELGDHSIDTDLQAVSRASQRLLQTIQGIVDLSRIETATFDVRPTPVDLIALVKEGVGYCRDQADSKRLSLTCEIDVEEGTIPIDEYCVRQSLCRLLDNSIKFTERGGVLVRLYREPTDRLCLSIRDTGIGIDPEYVPHLFKPFSQEDMSNTRRFEGPGIGLALVKRYLALNGAELSVTSEKGRGSTCTIRFAARESGGDASEHSPVRSDPFTSAERGRKRLVLIVGDDALTQAMVATTLRRDFETLVAATGGEARAQLAAHPDEIAIILMDLSLQGDEDGLTLTRWLRADPRWKQVPVIATTARTLPEDRQKAFDAGCTAFLAKPISRQDLQTAIERVRDHQPA